MFASARYNSRYQVRDDTYEAKVYIWETKCGNPNGDGASVGHASISLKKNNQKTNYVSMRPKYPLLVNPMTMFFPTPGTCAGSVEEDNITEGEKPDRTFSFPLSANQYSNMANKADEISNNISSNKRLYQLNPLLSKPLQLLSTRTGTEEFSTCPITGLATRKFSDDNKECNSFEVSHCALTIADILKSGGVETKTSLTPWKLSPSHLGDQLIYSAREYTTRD